MLKQKRRDGNPIEDVPAFTKLMPYLMPDKTGSVIFYQQELDVTSTAKFIKEFNRRLVKEREILTLFELVMCAAARAVCMRPRLNRFISGRRYYQRNRLLLSFVAKKDLTDEGKEVNVKVPFYPDDTLETTARKVRACVKRGIAEDGQDNEKIVDFVARLPRFLLGPMNRAYNWLDDHNFLPYSVTESDPMWSTIFLANVGSFGLDPPFHHLFERGTSPIFMAVGKVRTEKVLEEAPDGSPRLAERKTLKINYSFDDRIADGVYMGHALELVRRFIEHPAELAAPPELSPELLAELGLDPRPEDPSRPVSSHETSSSSPSRTSSPSSQARFR
jgi:hypothetical protein